MNGVSKLASWRLRPMVGACRRAGLHLRSVRHLRRLAPVLLVLASMALCEGQRFTPRTIEGPRQTTSVTDVQRPYGASFSSSGGANVHVSGGYDGAGGSSSTSGYAYGSQSTGGQVSASGDATGTTAMSGALGDETSVDVVVGCVLLEITAAWLMFGDRVKYDLAFLPRDRLWRKVEYAKAHESDTLLRSVSDTEYDAQTLLRTAGPGTTEIFRLLRSSDPREPDSRQKVRRA
jgi:hypothetical protein